LILSFQTGETKKVFNRQHSKKFNQIYRVALRKLLQLHFAKQLSDMARPPGNQLEALTKDRKGQHSIRINDQYRICFTWRSGHAYDVEIADYH
jgi:proteic killer suppression protein